MAKRLKEPGTLVCRSLSPPLQPPLPKDARGRSAPAWKNTQATARRPAKDPKRKADERLVRGQRKVVLDVAEFPKRKSPFSARQSQHELWLQGLYRDATASLVRSAAKVY